MNTPPHAPARAEPLGLRVQRLRQGRGLSIRVLAQMAGLNPGTLQKIEKGTSSPSVGTLQSILQALGTTLSAFFSMEETESGEQHIFRKRELVDLSWQRDVTLMGISFAKRGHALQVLHETYAPDTGTGHKALRHSGEDSGFCLSGTMELTLSGKRYLLGPGDGFHYRSELPHRWHNVGKTQAVVVAACTPPTF